MKVFDYIFYKIFQLYKKMGEKDADIFTSAFLALCQSANILTLIPLFISFKLNNWIFIIIYLSLWVFNSFCYFTMKRIMTFEKRWKNETKTMKYIGGGLTVLYIVASFTLCYFSLEYYQGYTNWKWNL